MLATYRDGGWILDPHAARSVDVWDVHFQVPIYLWPLILLREYTTLQGYSYNAFTLGYTVYTSFTLGYSYTAFTFQARWGHAGTCL